ncbi:MAG: ABC-type multidrug transport system, ATPase and permease component [Actinomycetia bacterium]|nr:ABC-type multidrug transport system, ATPase and permease component [Actinomycetes bacterium]
MRRAVRPHWGWATLGIGAGAFWTAARVSVPLMAGIAIDKGILKHDTGTTMKYVGIILLLGVAQAIATGLRRYGAFRMALRVETDMRQQLFAHLQRLHFAFHDQSQTGQLMARANTDIQQVNTVVILFPLTVASSLVLISVVTIILLTSPLLALLALGTLPFLNIAATLFTKRMQPVTLHLQEELAELSSVVEESFSGVRVVKGFGAESIQAAQLDHRADRVLDRSLDAARLRAWFLPLVDLLPTVGLVAILGYGGTLVIHGQIQLGTIVAFNSYILMLIWPLRMAGMLLGQASRSSAAAGRVHEILSTDPAIHEVAGAPKLPPGPGELRFENVTFGYGNVGTPVLDGLDLVLRGGEAVALVGATGSGKSTVARLVPRFYDIDSGTITLDGVDVREVSLANLRKSIGIVFEDTFLFSDSVRENISFADPEADMDTVRDAARLAGADRFIDALPEGYDTVIGEQGFSLSGGQRQRIAIARAVLAQPRVLILDDATSSVDPTKEHEIRAALREVMQDRTTLIIAHRPATIALADRVVLLDHGKVIAEGTHQELLVSSREYRAVLAQAIGSDADDPALDAAALLEVPDGNGNGVGHGVGRANGDRNDDGADGIGAGASGAGDPVGETAS